jgi:hypothetical protein
MTEGDKENYLSSIIAPLHRRNRIAGGELRLGMVCVSHGHPALSAQKHANTWVQKTSAALITHHGGTSD